jgi:hypothetical protein
MSKNESDHADDWITWDNITIKNIRKAYMQREAEYEGAKADKDRSDMKHWYEEMQDLLGKMTPDQRSWCMDDFDEIPERFKKVMAKVKEEEGIV